MIKNLTKFLNNGNNQRIKNDAYILGYYIVNMFSAIIPLDSMVMKLIRQSS